MTASLPRLCQAIFSGVLRFYPGPVLMCLGLAIPALSMPVSAEDPYCYDAFRRQIAPTLTRKERNPEVTRLFQLHGSFAQRFIRERFKEFINASLKLHPEASRSVAQEISYLARAWHRAYPNIPFVIPWPGARNWTTRQIRALAASLEESASASLLYHQGNFQQARHLWGRSRKVFHALGALHAESTLWMNLGLCEYELGDLQKAQRLLQRALAIKEQFGDVAGRRDCLMNLSLVAEIRGHYPRAKLLLDRAHTLNSRLCDQATEARILSSLGVLANETGRLGAAEQYYRRSLALSRLAEDVEGEATDISNLGAVLNYRGLLPEALAAYQESLQLRRDIGDREGEADSLLNLSKVYADMGRLSESLEQFFHALRIYEEIGSPHRMLFAWGQAGDIYLQLGDSGQATTFFKAGLELAIEHGFRAEAASFKMRLSAAAVLKKDYTGAVTLLQEALGTSKEIGDETLQGVVMLELGRVHRQTRHFQQTAVWLLQSYQNAAGNGMESTLAETALELGRLALELRKPGVAEQYFGTTLRLSEQGGMSDLVWQSYRGLSEAFEMSGRMETSIWYLKMALAQVFELESEIPLVSLGLHFWDDKSDLFRRLSRFAESKEDLSSAWAWTDLMKARLMKQSSAGKNQPVSPPGEGQPAGLNPNQELRNLYLNMSRIQAGEATRLARARLRIEDLKRSEPGKSGPSPGDSFSAVSPLLRSGALLREVQDRLAESEVLLDIILQPNSVWAWIMGRRDLDLVRLDMTEVSIERLMSDAGLWTGHSKTDPQTDPESYPFQAVKTVDVGALRRLGERFWDPISSRIPKGTLSLIIVPDGILHLLPFETLPLRIDRGSTGDSTAIRYVADDFSISYLPAASLLERRHPLLAHKRLNVVALAPAGGQAKSFGSTIGEEVEAMAEIFPGTRVFRGLKGMRDAFTEAAARADLLHIASHYQFNPQRPEFSRFILSAKNIETEPLFAFDIAMMKLRTAISVLSACNTGWGEVQPGEGLINMGRAFLVAGSKSVVLSLWPVEEQSTEYLMRRFYEFLAKGFDSRESLRRAKRELRKKPTWQHPFYWGSFVLVGNPVQIAPAAVISNKSFVIVWLLIAAPLLMVAPLLLVGMMGWSLGTGVWRKMT